ncbi:MAG: ATP-binding cassette domain-containing protein [Gemmatimonadota bacterium]|jgi:simple sugar transport system ATP-binding protein
MSTPPGHRSLHSGNGTAVLEADAVSVRYGQVEALHEVSVAIRPAAVTCLLGDNGAGKSTLIKVLSGVIPPSAGRLLLDGAPARFRSPRDARAAGIATLFQDLALAPLMSVWRNFVLGAEPVRGRGPLRRIDVELARRSARDGLAEMGIEIADVDHAVGRLSGGQRQAVAIARAVHHGARVLILDEPTAALGVRQAGNVLDAVRHARERGLAVILVTHNPAHAWPVGDHYVVLRHARLAGAWPRESITMDRLATLMAGEPGPGVGAPPTVP